MHLEHFGLKFEKLYNQHGINYSLGIPASEASIAQVEEKLKVSFPPKVALFYKNFNGLRVENPQLEILTIERLSVVFPNRLHFSTFDGKHRVYFDTSKTNQAEQWDIVAEDGFNITLTMPSFWSTHIFAWVEKKRVIWEENLEWKLEREKIEEQEKKRRKTGTFETSNL